MAKLPCPPDLWPAFSALLGEALELAEEDRTHWLAALGAEHVAVKPWLVKVLDITAGTGSTGFLRPPIVDDPALSEFYAGQRLGPYVLKRQLGSGGMGAVWLALRDDGQLTREVALKLPHGHLMAGVTRRRFERERDILAGLSHPHIAQLFDAGVAKSQHPYLAMELIQGVSINEHCRMAALSLERRIDLFLQILDAVGYAHGRLIAHRDLKPSNILVTRDQRIKLLDFGIAKLLRGDTDIEADVTQLTRLGSAMATPGYAAPEQLGGAPITVAVDLYALGVVLHELLTGDRPYFEGRKTPTDTRPAARASTRVQSEHAKTLAGMDARQLRRALRGDLDAIIAKALEAEPLKRYRSAELFALDLQRSREHRPIAARRISPTNLTLKFIRRHWLMVAMTSSLLLVLTAGIAGIAWQALRAEHEAQRAITIKDFLIGVFRASDPRISADKPRGEITARELLDVSAAKIEEGFGKQPDTQIELLDVTADIYRELDEPRRSTALYKRETELATRYLGAANVHTIDGLLGQAYNSDNDGDDVEALALLAKADPLIHQAALDRTGARARWWLMRGESLMNNADRGDEAQSSLEAAAALFATVAPSDPRYLDALADLGALSVERGKFAPATDYYRRAIAVAKPQPTLQGNVFLAIAGLPLALKYLGDFTGAGIAFEHATQLAAHTYGVESHRYWMIASDWARFRYERGERGVALATFRILLKNLSDDAISYRSGSEAVETSQLLRKYGYCLAIDGQGAEAVRILQRAGDLMKKTASHPEDAPSLRFDLGRAYQASGRFSEARDAFATALTMFAAAGAPASQLARAHSRIGIFLFTQKDTNAAKAEFDTALELTHEHVNESAVYAMAGVAAVALSRGDWHAGLETSAKAMDELVHMEGFYDIRVQPYVWGVRSDALAAAGETSAALALAQRASAATANYYSPQSAAVLESNGRVAALRSFTQR